MKYPELIASCKTAIKEGRCGGCQALENYNFTGNPNCMFSKTPSAQESIGRIFNNLGVNKNERK